MVTPVNRLLEHYCRRHRLTARGSLAAPWASDLRRAVVVPARGEGRIEPVLDSLSACVRPPGTTEVIVVVNASLDDPPRVLQENAATVREVAARDERRAPGIRFLSLSHNRIEPRHAGVGTARKLGLDEAALRLMAAGAPRGVIACLDADCTVADNYLTSLEAHFRRDGPAVALVHFEHPFPHDAYIRRAIVRYELHLRIYVNGLRAAAATLASHTVGSCIATTAHTYLAVGGMNRRQAGEDFYFVNKIAQRHPVSDLGTTCVYPASRVSSRVPFGTGRAMGQAAAGAEILTYDPRCYQRLGAVMEALGEPELSPRAREAAFGMVAPHMRQIDWQRHVEQCVAETSSERAYRKRIRTWFDGFKAMKLVHWLTDHHYPKVAVAVAAGVVYRQVTGRALLPHSDPAGDAIHERLALEAYRRLDRGLGLTSPGESSDV